MKAISEKKLIDVIQFLEGGVYSLPSDEQKDLISRLKDVLTCEMSATKVGRIDLQQYTSDVYPGVLHEDGRMVATNGYFMLSMTADYSSDLEGKVIGKDGKDSSSQFRNGKFPRWQSIVPEVKEWERRTIDFTRLSELFAEAKAHKKIYKKEHLARVTIGGGVWLDLWQLDKVARAMQVAGVEEMYYRLPGQSPYNIYPVAVKSEALIAVLQPCLPPEEEDMKNPALFVRTL